MSHTTVAAVRPAAKYLAAPLPLHLVWVNLLAITVTWVPAAVFACSPPAPGVTRTVEPSPGSANVVVNTEVRVRYKETGGGFLASMKPPALYDAMGQLVPTVVEKVSNADEEIYVIRPTGDLATKSTFTVKDWLGTTANTCNPYGGADKCQLLEVVAATFDTGTDKDMTPPTFGGLLTLESHWDSCDQSACCGPYAGWKVTFVWDSAVDNSPQNTLRYNVYRQDGPNTFTVGAYLQYASGATTGGYLAWATNLGILKDGPYEVCAVDRAGHETCTGNQEMWKTPANPSGADGGGIDGGGFDSGGVDGGEIDGGGFEVDFGAADGAESDAGSGQADAGKEVWPGSPSPDAVVLDVTESDANPQPDLTPGDATTGLDPDDVAADGTAESLPPPGDAGGCGAAPTGAVPPYWLVLFLLGVVVRRGSEDARRR